MNLDVLDEDRPPKVASDAPLAGKTVVVTGSMADPRSGEKIPGRCSRGWWGARRGERPVASSVSSATDMLICGEGVGAAKMDKAAKLRS